jgi:hypothetical protein
MSPTTTAPAPVWQASGFVGVGHAFTSLKPGVGVALCGDSTRPVAERWSWPIRSKCLGCLTAEGRPLGRRMRSAHR